MGGAHPSELKAYALALCTGFTLGGSCVGGRGPYINCLGIKSGPATCEEITLLSCWQPVIFIYLLVSA